MKCKCGPSWEAKFEAKKKWHRWFAWHPVRIGENDCRWLEYVKRIGDPYWPYIAKFYWSYKAIKK